MTTSSASFSIKWDHSLPPDWSLQQLSCIASVIDCKHKTPKYQAEGFPVVRPGDVKEGPLDLSQSPRCSLKEFEDLVENYQPRRGDIVYSRNASFGVAAYADTEEPFTIGQDVVIINSDKICTRYLYYLLNSLAFKHSLNRLSAGSTFQRVNLDDIRRYAIPVPPASVRVAIVETLSAVDSAIDSTQAVIKQTRKLKTALLQDLLTNGLPGRHSRFVSVKGIGQVPADWTVARLDEIAKVARGKFTHRPRNDPRFYGGEIPFVQTGDVVASGDFLRGHSQTLNEQGLAISRFFPKGTILFSIAASVGACTIASYDVSFPDSIVGITPNSDVDPLFLLRSLRMARDRILATSTESAQANISLELLEPLKFAIPSLDEQTKISDSIRAVELKAEKNTESLAQLVALKAALSQGLLTGQIPVNN